MTRTREGGGTERTAMRRLCKHMSAALMLMLAGAAAGCIPVRYEYSEPATAEGRACADACVGARQLCESRARVMEQQCRAFYQVQMTQYTMCQQNPRRPLCVAPDACPGPPYASCIRDFNDCFADCGGQVKEIEVDEANGLPPR